jgi:hypothetical protein
MPAGSGNPRHYPSLASWMRIIEGLHRRFPHATVELIGKLRHEGHPGTTEIGRDDLEALLDRYPFCRNRFDIDLLDQLTVVQRCSAFVSPHTGFAFAALAVGTPWLTISGGRWREFFRIGVPFYSVLPDPARYRAFDDEAFDRTIVDRDGRERIVSMCDARIEESLPEILDAAQILVERRWTYEQCVRQEERQWATLYETGALRWAALHARPLRTGARRLRGRLRSRRSEAEIRRQSARPGSPVR